MKNTLNKKSRYLSKLLRHNPEDLRMDKEGWVSAISILEKLEIDINDLKFIVGNNDKKRFSYQ